MQTIGLFYGSTNGTTEQIARQIVTLVEQSERAQVELLDVADFYLAEMLAFDWLILGVPTWNIGQLQKDWEAVFAEFDTLDLHGKQIALFGLGDQRGYPQTFGDALFFVADRARSCGAQIVGRWPTLGYTFEQSWAAEGEFFIGLLLDEDNQPELTAERLEAWVEQVLEEFDFTTMTR